MGGGKVHTRRSLSPQEACDAGCPCKSLCCAIYIELQTRNLRMVCPITDV